MLSFSQNKDATILLTASYIINFFSGYVLWCFASGIIVMLSYLHLTTCNNA